MSDDEDRFSDGDMEDEKPETKSQGSGSLNLTGFLFGNIDGDGKLEGTGILDASCQEKLGGLEQMLNQGTNLNAVLKDEEPENKSDEGDDAVKEVKEESEDENTDFSSKDPSAQDFSGIEEALSDEDSSDDSSEEEGEAAKNVTQTTSPNKAAAAASPPVVKKEEKEEPAPEIATSSKETTEESTLDKLIQNRRNRKVDEELMPPPSSAPRLKDAKDVRKPLASMLPDKYKDTDVRELFPQFRANRVLRFSRLFRIKNSHKPRIWKGVRKRKSAVKTEVKEKKEEKEEKQLPERTFDWDYGPWPQNLDAYDEDQAVKFHRPMEEEQKLTEISNNKKSNERKGPKPTDWRSGPAQYWYDMLGLPETMDDFDYTLKSALEHMDDPINKNEPEDEDAKNVSIDESKEPEVMNKKEQKDAFTVPDDAFFMVTQMNWEDDIVWNGEDIKHKVLQKLNSKTNAAGWVPTGFNRTAGSFSQTGKSALPGIKLQTMNQKRPVDKDDTWYSIFPVENEELVYGRWEDEVIWDSNKMPKLKPKIVSLDPNDDNIILGIPDDIDPATLPSDEPVRKVKIIQKHVKKSRMLLNRSGIISVVEEESPPPPPKVDDMDPFNISNDVYYQPKTQESLKVSTGRTLLQHATPVVELQAPFVPTHMGPIKLRAFHRPPLKRFSHGPLADYTSFYGVLPLQKHMKKKAKAREVKKIFFSTKQYFKIFKNTGK